MKRFLLIAATLPALAGHAQGYNPAFVVNDKPDFLFMSPAKEGLFAFAKEGKFGFVDRNLKVVAPAEYEWLKGKEYNLSEMPVFKNGYANLRQDGKWVVQNKYNNILLGDDGQVSYQPNIMSDWGMQWFLGGEAIPPLLSYTTAFREGKAIVRHTWKYTIIRSPLAK